MKKKFLATLIILFFIGIPILCLIIPVHFAMNLMITYLLVCLLGYFTLYFLEPQPKPLTKEEDKPSLP